MHVDLRFLDDMRTCKYNIYSIYTLVHITFEQCITVNIYGGSMLFRNLAFYRYRAGERLTQDIGFDIFPEMKVCLFYTILIHMQTFTLCTTGLVDRVPDASAAIDVLGCVCALVSSALLPRALCRQHHSAVGHDGGNGQHIALFHVYLNHAARSRRPLRAE
jgi:hypothetical protein